VLEFDRQVANLEQLGYSRLARMSNDAFARLFVPLRSRLADLPAELVETVIPFVLVLDRELVSAEQSMALVEQDGRRGVVDMNPTQPSAFSPVDDVDVPEGPAYLLTDVDTGKETLNVTPDNALSLITGNGRSPLTIEEGIAVLTDNPGVLRSMNAFSLLGSRRGDKRVPALWTSKGRPRLGWCWAGNPHAWLGSASCASRLGAGLASRGALTADGNSPFFRSMFLTRVKAAWELYAKAAGITRESFQALLEAETLHAEVANAAALVAPDQASAVTGTVVNVTCGSPAD
jgi:uncharacterized protein DUF5701